MNDDVKITTRDETFGNKPYTSFDIIIKELHGYGSVFFNPPLVVCGAIEKDNDIVHYYYDFGMEDEVTVKPGRNFLYNYAGNNEEHDPIKTVFASIKYDLLHAFNHYDGDPNFAHRHWALRECLRDKATAFDWCDVSELEKYKASLTAQMEFDFGT